jgi:hypothetical protein
MNHDTERRSSLDDLYESRVTPSPCIKHPKPPNSLIFWDNEWMSDLPGARREEVSDAIPTASFRSIVSDVRFAD